MESGDDFKANIEVNSAEQGKDIFFDKIDMSDKPLRWTKGQIITYLQEHKHINFTALKKVSHWKHSSLFSLIRELEFIRLIRTEIKVDENNREQKVIHYLEASK